MSYSPKNICVYLKALAGALSGLGSGHNQAAAAAANYYAEMADAYAQAFDTVWGTTAPTGFEEDAIAENSEAVWENNSPLESGVSTNPLAYVGIVTDVIAVVRAGNARVIAQGVDPDGCMTGSPSAATGWGAFVQVAASTTFAPTNAQRALLVDAGVAPAAQVVIEMWPAPVQGQLVLIKDDYARSATNPILLVPSGGGVEIPDFNAPGTYVMTEQAIILPLGGAVCLEYFENDDASVKRWIQCF